uniref:Type 2 allergen Lep d 5.04 n=1 Tax=Lepidoglyphus destructor TaxID=36936 RepID=Q1M2N0_LEPDS|nr:type 2 allergen Lep d 5.04 [Lepidoglyphus destructor]
MTGVKTHLQHELKRTDLNFLEKFNLDEITAPLNVLTKELTEVQKHVKAVESDEVAIPNPDEFRNEFDRLLIHMTEEQFAKLEQALAHLSHQVTELEKSKSKELKAQILREISIGLDFIDSAKGHFERELKRADLNLAEKFNFESALSTGAVLHKDLTALATKVKAIETK